MRGRSWDSVATIVAVTLLTSLAPGCMRQHRSLFTLEEMHIQKPVKRLVVANPEKFTKPLTLLILADESGTCSMREARWWRDWESLMLQRGMGFYLVTSQQDSVDMVVAGQLDSVHSPTLVLPSCKRYLGELGIPFVPVNLLVDSAGGIRYLCGSRMDSTASRVFLDTLAAHISRSRR
jgi:hypothetical protein